MAIDYEKIKVIDVFEDPFVVTPGLGKGGIFGYLYTLFSDVYDFLTTESAFNLDLEYFTNKSPNKKVSPLVIKWVKDNEKAGIATPLFLTLTQRQHLTRMIDNKYRNKWLRLYHLLELEYNPIENYSMIETETPSITKTHTPTNYKVTDTRTVQSEVVTETDGTQDIYGFNTSGTPVPSDSNHTSVTTSADPETNIETNTREESGTYSETETGQRQLTRSGNIGVTTNQQMMKSEVDLWQWNFFETMFSDVDEILTAPVYIN